MPANHAVRKLFKLTRRELLDLARAQRAIISAAWKLRAVKIGDLVRGAPSAARVHVSGSPAAMSGHSRPGARVSGGREVVERAGELALALGRVAEHGPLRPLCLVRSIALRSLLERNGVPGSEIRVGVRRKGDELLAHAWVEFNGAVIGDRAEYVAQFAPMDSLRISELV
jgi:hypothetical protein